MRELYSAGLALYSVAARLGAGPTAEHLLEASTHLDNAIKRLAVLVLALRGPVTGTGRFAARLFDTIATATPGLAHSPKARLAGPVGDLPEDLVDDLLAAARHALTDLSGHADASAIEVDITVADGGVRLQVATDGVEPARSPHGRRGDMGRRVAVRGTHLVAESRPSGGTRLTWAVPLH